jgi:hypothetical protein
MKLTTENAAHKLMNEIVGALKNKFTVGGIFCVLEKAFECVNQDILIPKLETYGIIGVDTERYQSCLNSR